MNRDSDRRRCCSRRRSTAATATTRSRRVAPPAVLYKAGPAVGPSIEAVNDGSYQPLTRPIFYYVSKQAADEKLPGATEKDIDVTVHNGLLFIRGERRPVDRADAGLRA